MKANLSVTAFVLVIVITIVAAVYRVATAPERVRLRLKEAQSSCTAAGGEWVQVDRHEVCRPAAGGKKS